MTVSFVLIMKFQLSLILFCFLCTGTLACFEEHPLESSLKEYLALKKSCADTLFPEPPCCGNSIEDPTRIINGEETGLKELTWNVRIRAFWRGLSFDNEYGLDFKCSGSLINSLWVLTAAHCFYKGNNQLTESIVGIEGPKAVRISSSQAIIHPKYDIFVPWRYDLALVLLQRPVEFSEFVNPICLPFTPLKKKCFENQKAIASGWGDTSGSIDSPSPKKLKTTLSVWKEKKCTKYRKLDNQHLNGKIQICANGGSNYTCFGDSGGPLSLKLPKSNNYYLLGVVAGGNADCDGTEDPAIFCRVDFKWLVDVILNTKVKPEE